MRLAQIVSFIFHPLLLTTYLVCFLGQWVPSMLLVREDQLLTFTGFIFGITFVLPALNILMFKQLGIIGSLSMPSRRERIAPMIFNAILYVLIAALFVYRVHLSTNFTKLMLLIAVLAVVAAVMTIFIKVSVHSLCWAAFVGIMVALNMAVEGTLLIPSIVLILIAGTVMSARLKLDAHTPREVLVGSITGLTIGFGGMYLLF